MDIDHLSVEDLKLPLNESYVDVENLHPLYEKIAFSANLILVGPKGVGKSLSVAAWAASHGYPTLTFDCSEDIRRPHLIGYPVLRGDHTPFVLGPLTTAIQIANQAKHCVLILEEINALTPQMQKVLNGIADWRRRIEVPEAKKVFSLDPDAKLWVTGTMNTTVYGGVYSLNEDLKSRFRILPLDYPTQENEKKILTSALPAMPAKLLSQVLTLANETRQQSMDYALSTRDLVQLGQDIASTDVATGLRLISGKFEGTDRGTFLERSKSIFGPDVSAAF